MDHRLDCPLYTALKLSPCRSLFHFCNVGSTFLLVNTSDNSTLHVRLLPFLPQCNEIHSRFTCPGPASKPMALVFKDAHLVASYV